MITHRVIRQAGILLALVAGLAGCSSGHDEPDVAPAKPNGKLYVNGKVYTQAAAAPLADGFVVADGKFTYVGTSAGLEEFRKLGYEVVDLGGRMVIPGLHDNHIHTLGTVAIDQCDLESKAVDLDQLAAKVRDCLPRYAPAAGDWLIVNQWVPYEGNEPTANHATIRAALDAASPDHPVVLAGTDGHASAYNSIALGLAQDEAGNTVGLSPESLQPGGVFETLAPYVSLATGVLREDARAVIPTPDLGALAGDSEQARALYGAILPDIAKLLASRGITSLQDACASELSRAMFEKMQADGLLHLRATLATCFVGDDYAGVVDIEGHRAQARAAREHFAGNALIKADAVKVFMDGVLEGDPFAAPPFAPNAGMLKNYQTPHLHLDEASGQVSVAADSEDSGNNGIVNFEEEAFKDYVSALDADGFAVHMHSIGDRSTRVAVSALEAARTRNGQTGNPHTIAHLQVVHPDEQRRLGALGTFLTYTYAWIGTKQGYDLLVTPFLEASQAGQSLDSLLYGPASYSWTATYPVESTRQAGAVLVAGSDAPVDSRDPRPFVNIAAGVTRQNGDPLPYNAEQRASLDEMLAAYTRNGARAVRLDGTTGSIQPGKSADFVVLDRNLYDLVASGRAAEIAETQVLSTVFQGQEVYRP